MSDHHAAQAERVGQCLFQGFSGRILMDGYEGRDALTFCKYFAHAVAGGFGRDHGHVHILRSLDLLEMDVEAVGEHQRLALGEVRRDVCLI